MASKSRPRPPASRSKGKVKTEYLMGKLECGCIRSLTMPEANRGEAGCIGYFKVNKDPRYPVLWTSLRHYEGVLPHFRSYRCTASDHMVDLSTSDIPKEMVHV